MLIVGKRMWNPMLAANCRRESISVSMACPAAGEARTIPKRRALVVAAGRQNARMLHRLAVLACALACAGASFAFDLQAHRGGRGLRPENTLPAFANALDIGVDTLELDIAVTADGAVVVSHDPY